ncbi:MAG: hypothetical protein PHI22_01500 [Bacilli bacterium]|nr:hypothetical protein [Bacilli bacterium]
MNLKVPFFNFNYLKENFKKSRGIIYLFILIIPIFTFLFMLLLKNEHIENTYFPSLAELSCPALIGMYIIPFAMAVVLFNFVFKKDSVDFINALPLKRKTIYITNIIGGIGMFFIMFFTTSLFMFLTNAFFPTLIIPKTMYYHFFITFFITYSYVFITSSLTLSLTGSRMTHIALTLILLFIPGFISDFYTSRIYANKYVDYGYMECEKYDVTCKKHQIYNDFTIKQSYKLNNNQTIPYKYINIIPRVFLDMHSFEITYESELYSVYNRPSLIKMVILSFIYFGIGLFFFFRRKMEMAESTFKSEDVHQLVKCLTLFPLCIVTIAIYDKLSSIVLWIAIAIIIVIYVVYDLITRRNSGKYIKSIIYFLGLVLTSIIFCAVVSRISNVESLRVIEKEDVSNIGIAPSVNLMDRYNDPNLDILQFELISDDIANIIFDNANKQITSNIDPEQLVIRFKLKDGGTYYFDMRLLPDDYTKLLKILDNHDEYTKTYKDLPYDKVYGVRLGDSYLSQKGKLKVLELIKEGYSNRSVSDIVRATYLDNNYNRGFKYSLMNVLYIYEDGIKKHNVSTMINPKLINYVMRTKNEEYIKEVKGANINVNTVHISIGFDIDDIDIEKYYNFLNNSNNKKIVYRYINDNISNNIDFSRYKEDELIYINIWADKSYNVFLKKDKAYEVLLDYIRKHVNDKTDLPLENEEAL